MGATLIRVHESDADTFKQFESLKPLHSKKYLAWTVVDGVEAFLSLKFHNVWTSRTVSVHVENDAIWG